MIKTYIQYVFHLCEEILVLANEASLLGGWGEGGKVISVKKKKLATLLLKKRQVQERDSLKYIELITESPACNQN